MEKNIVEVVMNNKGEVVEKLADYIGVASFAAVIESLYRECLENFDDAEDLEEYIADVFEKNIQSLAWEFTHKANKEMKKYLHLNDQHMNGNFANLYEGEWYNHEEFCPSDLKRFDYREELCDILEEDDFTYLLHDCKDIAFYEWSSTGYNQGDYVSGYAYCDKKRFLKYCDTNTKNWRKRALDLFEHEVKCIGLWMWGDVKGFVLEKKVHYKKVFTEIGREPEDDYDWEQIDSCWGEYYEDSDELIKDALEENGIKLKETA